MCSATDCCEPSHKPVSNLMFLCKRFHGISALTAHFQAAPDTFPHPLNHLTATFFKTSTFCLLPICHSPFLHLSFFTHFHLPCALGQPWGCWSSFCSFSPHIPAPGSCHHWWLCKQQLRESSAQQQPPPTWQALPRASILLSTLAYWTDFMPLGENPIP